MKALAKSGWLVIALGCVIAITTISGVVLNYSPVPFWDQWYGTVDWYMRAERDWWPSFWSLHNEHRLLFSRLIFWPDMHWFGGVNILSLASNVVVCGVLALSVYRAAIFRAALSPEIKLAIGGIALAFCFSWMQSDNFTWGFQNQWFAVNLFALLAFHSLSVSASKDHDARWFVAALLACVASCFSMANGMISWGVALVMMVYLRFPLRYFATTALTAAIVGIAYFHHASEATGSIPNGTLRYVLQHQLLDWVRWSILYLGSPMHFAFKRLGLAYVAGGVVVLASIGGVARALVKRDLKAVPLLAFALFLVGTAFATGTGRLVLGLANVFQERYATNGLMVWMALLLFWGINLNGRQRGVVYVFTAVALVAIGVCQRPALTANHDVLFERLVAGQALREGVYDHTYLTELWGHDEYFTQIVKNAKKEQISILASDPIGYDNPPSKITSNSRCAGFVDGTIPAETAGFSRAEGWVLADAEPKTVVITDVAGNTIGNGVVGKSRPDAAQAMKSNNQRLGWAAFYKTTSPIRVYAKTGRGYCMIN
jgi:hypothetical protein